jgi:hypothetical protein
MDPERDETGVTKGIPADVLEKLAEDQRHLLGDRVVELRQTVKQRLDVKSNLREHVWSAAGVLTLIGLALGYAVAGVFTRD